MPIDGDLNEWTPSERLEFPGSGSAGYELYGRVEGSGAEAKLVFAIRAPVGTSSVVEPHYGSIPTVIAVALRPPGSRFSRV